MTKIDDEEPDIILIQEPYEYHNKITGIDRRYRIYKAGTGKHRAAIIIINNNIDAILITKLSDEDTVVVEITHEKWKFFAASMYFDLKEQIEINFNKMDELMRCAKDGRILIAVDSNSRSKMWHDNKTNSRGRKLEEFLASRHLHIINKENERPTFFNNRGSSNIDLTIANNNLIADINEWRVSNEERSLLDHNYLQYKIRKGGARNQNYNYTDTRFIIKEEKLQVFDRNLVQEIRKLANNTHIEGGTEELDRYLSTKTATENDLVQQVDNFSEAVQTSCWRTFQITTTRKKNKNKKSVPWWTNSLDILRKWVNACRRLYQRTRNNEELREGRKLKYIEEKRKYQARIKHEKLNSWKEFCNVTASTNPWSQVYKLVSGKMRPKSIMTTLTKPDGSETTSIQETMEVLLDHLFEEDNTEENTHQKAIRKAVEEPIRRSDNIKFSKEEIKQVIDTFDDKKAPGIDGITGNRRNHSRNLLKNIQNNSQTSNRYL